MVIRSSAANLAPEIPRNAAQCRSCSAVACGTNTLSSTFGSEAKFAGFGDPAGREAIRGLKLRADVACPFATRRRKLIPNREHRTRNVPNVQPTSVAISAALRPWRTKVGIRAIAAGVNMVGFGIDHTLGKIVAEIGNVGCRN